jgi:plasmid stabilization system protein ParE
VTRLIVTRDAQIDLAFILDHLAREAGAILAGEFGRDLRAALDRLCHFPDSGSPRREFGAHVRLTIIYPYRLFHERPPAHPELVLLRILHRRSSLSAEILMRPGAP